MVAIMTPKKGKEMSVVIDICFLIIHILMFCIFYFYNVTPMMYFNIFSVSFYIIMPFVILRGFWRTFAVGVYLEVIAHMSAAIYFLGWDYGFQVTMVGMCILVFYAEYVGRSIHVKHVNSVFLCVIGVAAYLASYIVSIRRPAPYVMPDAVRHCFEIGWGIIVFSIAVVFLKILVLITSRSEAILSNEVLHDKLTGLPNRYYMADYFNKMTGSHGQKKYWLAIADLDDFKRINDTYGHNCGDYVLKTVANLLDEHSVGAVVCRWGGEEFLISDWIADDGMYVTLDLLNHMRRVISEHQFRYEGHNLRITITIGCAWHQAGQTTTDLVEDADKKLYEGKTSGKNKVVM